jgi:hypothetical protein
MKIHLLLVICLIIIQISRASAQEKSLLDKDKELKEMYVALEKDSVLKSMIVKIGEPSMVLSGYKMRALKSDSIWIQKQKSLGRIKNLGSTKRLEIIPIVEAF